MDIVKKQKQDKLNRLFEKYIRFPNENIDILQASVNYCNDLNSTRKIIEKYFENHEGGGIL